MVHSLIPRKFCVRGSFTYHAKPTLCAKFGKLRHPQPMDISLCRGEHGYLPWSRAAWCVNEPRTQNFRGISECTTKIQAQDCERTYLAAIDLKWNSCRRIPFAYTRNKPPQPQDKLINKHSTIVIWSFSLKLRFQLHELCNLLIKSCCFLRKKFQNATTLCRALVLVCIFMALRLHSVKLYRCIFRVCSCECCRIQRFSPWQARSKGST